MPQLVSIASTVVAVHLWEESSFLFSAPSSLVDVDSNSIFEILLRLSKPNSLSHLLYVTYSPSWPAELTHI